MDVDGERCKLTGYLAITECMPPFVRLWRPAERADCAAAAPRSARVRRSCWAAPSDGAGPEKGASCGPLARRRPARHRFASLRHALGQGQRRGGNVPRRDSARRRTRAGAGTPQAGAPEPLYPSQPPCLWRGAARQRRPQHARRGGRRAPAFEATTERRVEHKTLHSGVVQQLYFSADTVAGVRGGAFQGGVRRTGLWAADRRAGSQAGERAGDGQHAGRQASGQAIAEGGQAGERAAGRADAWEAFHQCTSVA